ncbi:MAG: 16S rRNA (guanine(966)-N(2))-methyltransferase RsmD [Gemmatimonadales bacterium]|nr:MAG: 16S rRNA (guanine(966)-N(2))-methyltransferase RsmD [Gemmatimonadales bacterium]
MRIVGGKWAGASLASPGPRVRPTREDMRAAWISGLEADLHKARILDLFAGTGALGLEAMSRGAASVDFVENGAPALHSLKANLAKLRVRNRTRLFKKDVFLFVEGLEALAPEARVYDLALADPPYTSRAAERLVTLWLERPFSRILSLEHAAERSLPGRGDTTVFGDSAFTTYRSRGPNPGV